MFRFTRHRLLQMCTLLFLIAPLTLAQNEACPSFCRYRLCASLLRDGSRLQRENRVFAMGFPDEPLGPFPCIERASGKAQPLRNVTGGEASVAKKFSTDRFVRLSRYLPGRIAPAFPSDFFKWVRNPETGESAVQRGALEGNQKRGLEGLCVRMPVSSFLRRGEDGSLRRVWTKGKRACVGFRPATTKLDVKFEWSSSNDFDLRVTEPNGFEINRFGPNRASANGGNLVADNGYRTCQIVLGQEQVLYAASDTVEKGVYRIAVDHFRVCEKVSKYRLRVKYRESVVFEETGVVGEEQGQAVIQRNFTIA